LAILLDDLGCQTIHILFYRVHLLVLGVPSRLPALGIIVAKPECLASEKEDRV
jgi:hypothetical protein